MSEQIIMVQWFCHDCRQLGGSQDMDTAQEHKDANPLHYVTATITSKNVREVEVACQR
jgi:hypothetical protein